MLPRNPKRNLWDRLPTELQNVIIEYSMTPLTMYLNKRITLAYEPPLPNGPSDSNLLGKQLWIEAFDLNWDGNISSLPVDELPDLEDGLCRLKSTSLYRKLCDARPDLLDLRNVKQFLSNRVKGTRGYEFPNHAFKGVVLPFSSLLHVPIANVWLELLNDWFHSNLVMLGWIAITSGHAAMLQHLIDNHGINPQQFRLQGWSPHSALWIAASSPQASLATIKVLLSSSQWTHDQILEAIERSATIGDLETVELLWSNITHPPTQPFSELAHYNIISNCHADILDWLNSHWTCDDFRTFEEYIRGWYLTNIPSRKPTRINSSNRLRTLQYLHQKIGIRNMGLISIQEVAALCDLECTSYIIHHFGEPFRFQRLQEAAEAGPVEFTKALIVFAPEGRAWTNPATINFIYTEKPQFVFDHNDIPWALDQHVDLDTIILLRKLMVLLGKQVISWRLFHYVVKFRELVVLKYLYFLGGAGERWCDLLANTAKEKGIDQSQLRDQYSAMLVTATQLGDLPLVQFLYKTRPECTYQLRGLIDGFKSLIGGNVYCPCCVLRPIEAAAEKGHLYMLIWLCEQQGGVYNPSHALGRAMKGGSHEVVEWIKMRMKTL
ncbi:hypothetical protein HDU76_002963 [Blyttiomyces sp. JEL0837]|nr:hypothetical protein HDU76_002963 [Blyttiomyces sp. JEL0837]